MKQLLKLALLGIMPFLPTTVLSDRFGRIGPEQLAKDDWWEKANLLSE
jgi:hypothetical protein